TYACLLVTFFIILYLDNCSPFIYSLSLHDALPISADDDDVAGHGVLELHPCLRASTGQVDAVCALGHHTFESELPAGVHGVVDVPVEGFRDMDALAFGYVVPQPLPSIGIGHAPKRGVSCLEQVEGHEVHRCPAT